MLLSLYFPVTCNPSRAVTLPNVGVPHYIEVSHRTSGQDGEWVLGGGIDARGVVRGLFHLTGRPSNMYQAKTAGGRQATIGAMGARHSSLLLLFFEPRVE